MTTNVEVHDIPPSWLDAVLRNDMASFVRAAFAELCPGVELVWDPYLDLICARLQALAKGEITNLIITMPPRHLKSICASVALPAFFMGHHPSKDVMCVSYGQELAKKFAEDTRKVMTSDFYRRIFDTQLINARQSPHALKTTAGGMRRATSIDGAATGVGADLLIFDDPQKPNETFSEAVRRSTNQAYENTFLSRRNDPGASRTLIVMQRLHEDDFVGHVLGLGGEWELLNLPAIAEKDEVIPYETFLGRHEYRRSEGAALHPGRVPLEELQAIREQMGEAAFAGQYMQRPAPAGGGLVKIEWFRRYTTADLPAQFDQVVQSWDCANKTQEWNDFSVCTTWGVEGKRMYLLNVFRQKLIYPDLKRAVIEQARAHQPTIILIEDKASGTQLLQELGREGGFPVQAVETSGDKQMRMASQTSPMANGFVYIPTEAHWLVEYLHELAVFPNGRRDDQVDSTSQAIGWIANPRMKGWGLFELMRREHEARQAANGSGITTCYQPGSMEWLQEQAALKAAGRC